SLRKLVEVHRQTVEKVIFAVSELEESTSAFPKVIKGGELIFAITAGIGNADGELVVPKWKIRLNE
ncbi:hypothetical protein DBR06_SOUSAS12910020, partial [Sousa chinensis]